MAEAPGLVAGVDDVRAVRQAVDDGFGQASVGEDLGPLAEGQVGGDDQRAALVALGKDLEDELGYLGMPGDAASHLFQVISRRYEHGSIVLTTNRGIADWGQIFEDTTVAAAILDRLLHHATVLQIDGDSYRMRGHRARLATLRASLNHPTQSEENSRSQLGISGDR